jgi:nitroreductase
MRQPQPAALTRSAVLGVAGPLDRRSAEAAVAVAIQAPSIYNTQPWCWELGPAGLALRADRSRQLAVADPDGHSLMISCGAALALAELGLRAEGWTVAVERLPDPADPDLLAWLRPQARVEPTPLDLDRVRASRSRHSDRRPYPAERIPEPVIERLRGATSAPGVYVHFPAHQDEYIKLAVAVSRADRIERHNTAYVQELARWVRTDDNRPDGVPVTAVPHVSPTHPRHTDVALRNFELAAQGLQLIDLHVDEHPLLAVVFTNTPGRLGHLQGGEAMMRLMLEARLLGLATCPLSQAVDLLEFRGRLQAVMGWPDYPQMMLKLGVAPTGEAPRTPRRPVADVLHVHAAVAPRA